MSKDRVQLLEDAINEFYKIAGNEIGLNDEAEIDKIYFRIREKVIKAESEKEE